MEVNMLLLGISLATLHVWGAPCMYGGHPACMGGTLHVWGHPACMGPPCMYGGHPACMGGHPACMGGTLHVWGHPACMGAFLSTINISISNKSQLINNYISKLEYLHIFLRQNSISRLQPDYKILVVLIKILILINC